MGGSSGEREAEWYRRRRAEKDGIPLPAEFRLRDDEDGISVRFPVSIEPRSFPPVPSRAALRGSLVLTILLLLVFFLRGDPFVVVLLLMAATLVVGLPFALLRSVRRVVSVRAEGVEVAWWPLPLASRRLVSRAIVQAFVLRRGRPLEAFPGEPEGERSRGEFDLWIVRPDGSREMLVGSLRTSEHALYLERWLERRLGIEDETVAGEFGS